MHPRIVLIHATPLAVAPVNQAFARLWPEANISNLLDDALSVDRANAAALTPRLCQRIERLVDYAESLDAGAILFTCSSFGDAIEASAAAHPLPVLKPNEAMFDAALAQGKRIVMLVTFPPAVAAMETEFRALARRRQHPATLTSVLVEGARDALEQGDAERHNRLIVEAAIAHQEADALILAHFSMEIAFPAVQAAVACPVLSSTQAAIARLKDLMAR